MASPTPIRTPSRRTEACAAGGFTLLELLVVMGLLSVLTGMAVGVLGRRDPHMIAASTIGGACRAAQVTARSQGVPTEVWLRPGVDNQPASVQTLLLRPVAVFGFEPGQSSYDEALVPMLGGEDVPSGRFGHARSSGGNTKSSLLRWPVTPSVMDLRDGFVCRLDGLSPNAFCIEGSRGWIELPDGFWHAQSLRWQRQGEALQAESHPFARNGFEAQMQACAEALEQGWLEHPQMPAADTLATLGLIDALRERLGAQ